MDWFASNVNKVDEPIVDTLPIPNSYTADST